MKTKKLTICATIFIFCFVCSCKTFAQKAESHNNYRNAVGLRAGETSGITVKHFFTENTAIECIVGSSPYATGITGLFEHYTQLKGMEGLYWYYGGGAHISFNNNHVYYAVTENGRYQVYRYNYPGLYIGFDGVIGLEYRMKDIPLSFSLDVKPFIEGNPEGVLFTALDPSVGIKFTFK